MKLGIPQMIYLVLTAMELGMYLVKHGERRNDKYNFFIALISQGIILWILYLGGFFN